MSINWKSWKEFLTKELDGSRAIAVAAVGTGFIAAATIVAIVTTGAIAAFDRWKSETRSAELDQKIEKIGKIAQRAELEALVAKLVAAEAGELDSPLSDEATIKATARELKKLAEKFAETQSGNEGRFAAVADDMRKWGEASIEHGELTARLEKLTGRLVSIVENTTATVGKIQEQQDKILKIIGVKGESSEEPTTAPPSPPRMRDRELMVEKCPPSGAGDLKLPTHVRCSCGAYHPITDVRPMQDGRYEMVWKEHFPDGSRCAFRAFAR